MLGLLMSGLATAIALGTLRQFRRGVSERDAKLDRILEQQQAILKRLG